MSLPELGSGGRAFPLIVREHPDVESIEADWLDLARRVRAPAFMHPSWFRCWFECSAGRGSPLILGAWSGSSLVGVMPLIRHRTGALSVAVGSDSLDYEPICGAPGVAASFGSALIERHAPYRFDFSLLAGDGELWSSLSERAKISGSSTVIDRKDVPVVRIDASTWDEYETGLAGEVRRGIRRKRRQLERIGAVSLKVHSDPDECRRLLRTGFELEGVAWKLKAGTAILSDPNRTRYYEGVAGAAAQAGVLRLAFLEVDGRAAAFHLCIEDAGRHYMYKVGYDPSFAKCSPGMQLAHMMIERAFGLGLSEYNFAGKAEPWKLQLSNGVIGQVQGTIFGAGIHGRMSRMLEVRARPVARRIKRRLKG